MKQYMNWSDMILSFYFYTDMLDGRIVNKYTFNGGATMYKVRHTFIAGVIST